VRLKWNDLEVKDAFPILDEVRWVKSPAELALLREAAAITAGGFWAGVRAIAPGQTQRQVEGEVIRACLNRGSDGLSLWPWVRSGPFTMPAMLFRSIRGLPQHGSNDAIGRRGPARSRLRLSHVQRGLWTHIAGIRPF
jgi:hypothetical protein